MAGTLGNAGSKHQNNGVASRGLSHLIRINSENEKDLQRLVDVSPVIARRIAIGRPFHNKEELVSNVRGLSMAMIDEWVRQGFELDFANNGALLDPFIGTQFMSKGSEVKRQDYENHRSDFQHFGTASSTDLKGKFVHRSSDDSIDIIPGIKGGAKLNQIQSQISMLASAKKAVNDHLTRLEDPPSAAWLREQLEELNGSGRASLVSKLGVLQSQIKNSKDQTRDLMSQSKDRDVALTAALQRQQDARLRTIARNNIRRSLENAMCLWRTVRLRRAKCGAAEYKLILLTLNRSLWRQFQCWLFYASHRSRVRRVGVRNLALILNFIRKNSFDAWNSFRLLKAKAFKSCSQVIRVLNKRLSTSTFSAWKRFHQQQRRISIFFTKLRVRHLISVVSWIFLSWLEHCHNEMLLSRKCWKAKKKLQRIQLERAWADFCAQCWHRRGHANLVRRVGTANGNLLKSVAFEALQSSWKSAVLVRKANNEKCAFRLASATLGLWNGILQERKRKHRNGIKVVLLCFQKTVFRTFSCWAIRARLQFRIRGMAARNHAQLSGRGLAAALTSWKRVTKQRLHQRSEGIRLLMKSLRGLLQCSYDCWHLGTAFERKGQALLEKVAASKEQQKSITLKSQIFHEWNRIVMANSVQKYVGLKVFLRSLRSCMGNAFSQWAMSKFNHAEVIESKLRPGALEFVYAKLSKFRLSSFLEGWLMQARSLSKFRRDGQRLVLRCVSHHLGTMFRSWVQETASRHFDLNILAWIQAKSKKFSCQKFFLNWHFTIKPDSKLVKATRQWDRNRQLMINETCLSLIFLNWALLTSKSVQSSYRMNSDQLAFYHLIAIKQAWMSSVSSFAAWRNVVNPAEYADYSGQIVDNRAVVMSSLPKLKFQPIDPLEAGSQDRHDRR